MGSRNSARCPRDGEHSSSLSEWVTNRGFDERVYLYEPCSHDGGRDTYDDGIYQDGLALSLSDDGGGVLGASFDLQGD